MTFGDVHFDSWIWKFRNSLLHQERTEANICKILDPKAQKIRFAPPLYYPIFCVLCVVCIRVCCSVLIKDKSRSLFHTVFSGFSIIFTKYVVRDDRFQILTFALKYGWREARYWYYNYYNHRILAQPGILSHQPQISNVLPLQLKVSHNNILRWIPALESFRIEWSIGAILNKWCWTGTTWRWSNRNIFARALLSKEWTFTLYRRDSLGSSSILLPS